MTAADERDADALINLSNSSMFSLFYVENPSGPSTGPSETEFLFHRVRMPSPTVDDDDDDDDSVHTFPNPYHSQMLDDDCESVNGSDTRSIHTRVRVGTSLQLTCSFNEISGYFFLFSLGRTPPKECILSFIPIFPTVFHFFGQIQ